MEPFGQPYSGSGADAHWGPPPAKCLKGFEDDANAKFELPLPSGV